MIWTGLFLGSSGDIGKGVEGYFSLAGVGLGAQIPTVNDVETTTQVSFRAPNYLGRITFFGEGLQVANITLNNGQAFPVFTEGTITGIEYLHNFTLDRALEQGISDPALYLPSLLEPSATLQLPNVSAAALSASIVQSYNTGTRAPFENFVSSFQLFYVGTDAVNIITGANGNDLLVGLGGNDALAGAAGNDTLDGGPGSDGLEGGEGSDLYLPGPSGLSPTVPVGDSVRDTGVGVGDIDTISYANATSAVTVDLNSLDGNQNAGWAAGLIVGGIERVIGSPFDDILYGSEFPESIQDTASDTLEGGAGDDTLVGFAGSDVLQGGPGFDVLFGGENGDIRGPGPGDVAVFNAASSQVDVFTQADGSVLVAAPGGGVDVLVGVEFLGLSNGTFAIGSFAQSGKQLVVGGPENDARTGGNGNDLIFGRAGNDSLSGSGGNDSIDGGNGDDSLSGDAGNDTMMGALGNDTMRGGAGSDLAVIRAALATVFVEPAAGGVVVTSSDGRDFIASDVEQTAFADTTLSFAELSARAVPTVNGTEAGENVEGTPGTERISAFGGADWITPGTGSDSVDGGEGRDMVSFFNLPDTPGRTNVQYRLDLDLGAGRATTSGADVYTLSNLERVTGTVFADRMRGTDAADEMRGLGDYDWFVATTGNDTYDGGTGQDMISYVEWETTLFNSEIDVFSGNGAPPPAGETSGVRVDLTDPGTNTHLAQGHSYVSVERITGSGRQDVFVGDGGQNDFRGLGDYDWFVASDGGRERYFGGDGVDTVTYYTAPGAVTASLRNGARVNGEETGYGTQGWAARDLYFEIENLAGSRFGDNLTGNNDRNQINGLAGDDIIFGYGGIDQLKGGAGNDTINGGGSSDYAIYEGNRAAYTLTKTASNTVTITGAEGTDSLIDVEYFRFADGDVTIWELPLA